MHASTLKQGQTLHTQSGTAMTVVAFLPQAKPDQRLVTIDAEGEIHAYWDDGKYALDRRPCGLDLVG